MTSCESNFVRNVSPPLSPSFPLTCQVLLSRRKANAIVVGKNEKMGENEGLTISSFNTKETILLSFSLSHIPLDCGID